MRKTLASARQACLVGIRRRRRRRRGKDPHEELHGKALFFRSSWRSFYFLPGHHAPPPLKELLIRTEGRGFGLNRNLYEAGRREDFAKNIKEIYFHTVVITKKRRKIQSLASKKNVCANFLGRPPFVCCILEEKEEGGKA